MSTHRYKVKFFIHHKSGKYPYKNISTFTGSQEEIMKNINDHVTHLQKRINKKFTYSIVNREKFEDDIDINEENVDIATKSKDMSAEDAIKFIKENSFTYLKNGNFISDNEDRITVINAYSKKEEKQSNNK